VRRITALSIAAACLFVAAPRPAAATGAEEAAVVASINSLRSSRGLSPLEVHAELELKAEAWASHMSSAGVLAHSELTDGITADWLELAENVAIGSTLDHTQQVLLESPGHFANMVKPEFTHIGVGVVSAGGRVYLAQEFMQLPTAAAPAPSAAPAPTPGPPAAPAPAPRPAAPAPAPTPAPAPPTPAPPAAPAEPAEPAPAPDPVVATPPTPFPPAVTAPAPLPAPPITPVTYLDTPEGPEGTGSRAASAGLAVALLLLVTGALVDWARPRRG
jgi:hypothetical protein